MTLQTIKTKLGLISPSTRSNEKTSIYLGIPYAKAPVGQLRWRSPQPHAGWDGVRVCEDYGPSAPQAPKQPGQFYTKEFPISVDERFDEDCLYLNIYTPANREDALLPVLLNIHGGGFTGGSGRDIQFDGTLSEQGVILVNINYRLGIFGFLAHPWLQDEEACGSFGIADQIAALTWVHENIAAFGGDPNKITLLGQSAGAMSIQLLSTAPSAQGLFTGAIMESGGGILPGMDNLTLDQAKGIGSALCDMANITSLEQLRNASIDVLHKAVFDVMSATKQMMMFMPSVGSTLLPYSVSEAVETGNYANVPYILGSNASEYPIPGMDQMCHIGAITFARKLLEQKKPAPYIYQFNRAMPGDDVGAFHSAELWYVFGSMKHCWRPLSEGDYELSHTMMKAWVAFAKSGNPELSEWNAYDGTVSSEYVFDVV